MFTRYVSHNMLIPNGVKIRKGHDIYIPQPPIYIYWRLRNIPDYID